MSSIIDKRVKIWREIPCMGVCTTFIWLFKLPNIGITIFMLLIIIIASPFRRTHFLNYLDTYFCIFHLWREKAMINTILDYRNWHWTNKFVSRHILLYTAHMSSCIQNKKYEIGLRTYIEIWPCHPRYYKIDICTVFAYNTGVGTIQHLIFLYTLFPFL